MTFSKIINMAIFLTGLDKSSAEYFLIHAETRRQ